MQKRTGRDTVNWWQVRSLNDRDGGHLETIHPEDMRPGDFLVRVLVLSWDQSEKLTCPRCGG